MVCFFQRVKNEFNKKLVYKEVPLDTRYNYKRDLIGNVYSGVFSGIFSAFMAIIARKYFHASAFEISILTSIGYFAGILSFFVTTVISVIIVSVAFKKIKN